MFEIREDEDAIERAKEYADEHCRGNWDKTVACRKRGKAWFVAFQTSTGDEETATAIIIDSKGTVLDQVSA